MAGRVRPVPSGKIRNSSVTCRVLSVGQCAFDDHSLGQALAGQFDAELVRCASGAAAVREGNWKLVLVNRLLDADGSPGLDVVRQLRAEAAGNSAADVPVMLVSNFAEARQAAEAEGAVPGFGKSDLGGEVFRERLAPWLS